MTNTTKIVIAAIVALVIGFTLGADGILKSASLGATAYDVLHQAGDLRQGMNDVLMMTNGSFVGPIALNAGNSIKVNGVVAVDASGTLTGVVGGSAHATLAITTSTALAGGWDCSYDTVSVTTSTAGITLTLPPATSTNANCLLTDSSQEDTLFQVAIGNNFNTTFATSTGDIFAYNATSSPGGLVMTTSTTATYYTLKSYRLNSSTDIFTLGYNGVGH